MILAAPIRRLAASGGDAGLSAVGQNLRAGARVLIDTPILRSLFLVFTLVFVSFGLSNSLLLPFAVTALDATEFEYGVQEAITSIGFVVGSLMMAKMADRFREGLWIAVGFIAMALAGIGYSSMTAVAPAIAIIMISGFLNAPASIARRLVIQRNTPRDMRGRVNSAFFVCRDVLTILGMAAAGLADILPVRIMYLISALMLLAAGVWALFMPGLGQPAAEWKRALKLLREAPITSGLAADRPATLADFDALTGVLPSLSKLGKDERQALIRDARVSEAAAGTTIIRHGDKADDAYFVLAGKAVAGIATESGGYRSLSTLNAGDFFGEIAALTGLPRTADVVAEQKTRLLTVPATALRRLMADPALRQLVVSKMGERLSRTHTSDWPRLAGVDQAALRELRTTGEEISS
jgi:MFS family permease